MEQPNTERNSHAPRAFKHKSKKAAKKRSKKELPNSLDSKALESTEISVDSISPPEHMMNEFITGAQEEEFKLEAVEEDNTSAVYNSNALDKTPARKDRFRFDLIEDEQSFYQEVNSTPAFFKTPMQTLPNEFSITEEEGEEREEDEHEKSANESMTTTKTMLGLKQSEKVMIENT